MTDFGRIDGTEVKSKKEKTGEQKEEEEEMKPKQKDVSAAQAKETIEKALLRLNNLQKKLVFDFEQSHKKQLENS